MESSSPTRLSRLTAIITMLQSRRLLTAGDIAERFQISRRTAYRDLKALEEAGIPLYVEEGKGYALVDGFSLPPMMFSQEEANALITAEKMVAQNADASFVQHFQQAMTKIRAVFSAEAQDRTELLEERIVFRQNQAPEGPSQSLATIQTAIADFRVLRIAYQKTPAEAAETRKIEPLALYQTQGNWILIAWCQKRDDHRSFRLDRIHQLNVLDQTFDGRDFDLQAYFKACWEKYLAHP